MYKVNHTQSDKEEFLSILESGATAVFLYSPRVLQGVGANLFVDGNKDIRAVAFGGVIYVPASFFEKFLGIKAGATEPKSVGEIPYLSLIETARKLGFAAECFYDGRLAVVGTSEHIVKMQSNPSLEEAGAYTVIGEYNVEGLTSEDYAAVRKKWKDMLVGTPETNDLNNPSIKGKIDGISQRAEIIWSKMNKEPDRKMLWGKGAPIESVEVGRQYISLQALAVAWGTYGSTLYQNEELARDIVEGMQWMYENMYGEAEIEGRGWRDIHIFNWWDWYVPTPTYMTDVFFIMEEYFPLEVRRRYMRCFEYVIQELFLGDTRHHALGRIEVYAKFAFATERPELLQVSNEYFDWLLEICETGNGPRIDYVHWAHDMPYNNAYGRMLVARLLNLAYVVSGTVFEYSSPRSYNLFNIAKYMYETASYKGNAMSMMCGRQNDAPEYLNGADAHSGLLRLIGMFGEEEDEYIMDMFARQAEGGARFLEKAKKCVSIAECLRIDAIVNREKAVPRYNYAHAWFTAERAVQHRNEYAFALSLSSNRGLAFESICNVNGCGWHLGDGATHIYTNYDLQAFDGENFYLRNKNIAQHFPGTTEDVRPRLDRPISGAENYRAPNDYAGSMQVEDKYIVAAMDFVSYNIKDRPDRKYGEGYSAPNFDNDLKAKKAWFCFDKEMLCLGAGIDSTMNSEVVTTVDHRRVVDPENDRQYVNGTAVANGKISFGKGYVNFEKHAGYVIMSGGGYANRYVCEEAAGKTYFEVGISHGENPTDETYAYAVLPYVDNSTLDAYAKSPEVDILANTRKVQCVRKASLGITAYVFHEAGECEGIKVSAPCIVTLTEKNGEYTVSVCEPTQKAENIEIEIGREINVISNSKKVSWNIVSGKSVINVDTAKAYGRKFEVKYR